MNLIGSEALLLNSHHLKMQESINYRLFLLLWSIWRPAVLTLWQIIVLPLDDPTFLFCLRDIQVCHMKAVLFLYPLLDLLICSTLLKAGHIHVFEREFNSDILSRYISLGKLDYRLHMNSRCKTIHRNTALPVSISTFFQFNKCII